ncbi:MAG: GAF domain-containing protein [Firmicutes bacterium]|nr:GAF domain-containing protein [Bacillota bacterium]
MVIKNKKALIEKLTGIHSSKKSYYVQLKKKIDEITRRNIQLEIINRLAKAIGIDMSFQEIVESIIPELQAVVAFDTISLYVIDKGTMVSRTVFVTNNREEKAPESSGREKVEEKTSEALLEVFTEKRTFLIDHRTGEPSVSDESGFLSTALIPLLVKERVIGVLEVICENGFEESDLHFLEQVADQLAVCLENARLYSEVWQHKQEWEITFSAVTDLLLFINREYRVQRVNQAVIDFFTMPEEEILGQKCYHLFYGRESKCNPCLMDQVVRTQKTAYQQSRIRFNRVLDIFAYPAYTEKGKAYGVTYYAKDVTRFVDSIKFVSLGEMSAGVAHELNSPLTAIVGNSQLLLRETDPEEPHYQLIKDIKNSGMRCQRIIQNLLTFSRQEEYSFEEIDLNDVVESALSLLSFQIEKSNIELVMKPAPSLPRLMGNEHGLEQIIINLLLNAKDAIASRLAAGETREKGRIVIETSSSEKVVAVHIRDNGIGIDYDDLPQVFNPFFTTKRVGRGTGLGLSVSLGIAQSHGGVIDVESVEGGGSEFSLILPLDKAYEKEGNADE